MAEDEVTTRWMVIPPGREPVRIIEGKLPANPSLQRLRATILPLIPEAEYMEHVSVLAAFSASDDLKHRDMFVSESGHKDMLPRNDRATAIYRQATMAGRSGAPVPADPEDLPWIAGTAVLFERRIWR